MVQQIYCPDRTYFVLSNLASQLLASTGSFLESSIDDYLSGVDDISLGSLDDDDQTAVYVPDGMSHRNSFTEYRSVCTSTSRYMYKSVQVGMYRYKSVQVGMLRYKSVQVQVGMYRYKSVQVGMYRYKSV